MAGDDPRQLGSHFDFGGNWSSYSGLIDEDRIRDAETALGKLVHAEDIVGKSFLDIGCGSGLHLLAASRLGAGRLVGIDIDPKSVVTAERVQNLFGQGVRGSIMRASVFDLSPEGIGQFDIVYSWGVLHHTGAMREAIVRATRLVGPRGLFVVALYRKTLTCRLWRWEKRWYSRASPAMQRVARTIYTGLFRFNLLLARKSFRAYLHEYDRLNRGMDFSHDLHDWMGGYPYESTSPGEFDQLMTGLGFRPERRFLMPDSFPLRLGLFGSGNDEYVYRKR